MWPMVFFAVHETGEQQFLEFCNKNILSDKPDIFQELKKNNLRTFEQDVFNKRQ